MAPSSSGSLEELLRAEVLASDIQSWKGPPFLPPPRYEERTSHNLKICHMSPPAITTMVTSNVPMMVQQHRLLSSVTKITPAEVGTIFQPVVLALFH